MYKFLNFKDFFNKERQEKIPIGEEEIALSLISPNQMIHAIPDGSRCIFHSTLALEIISDIYKIVINFPINEDYYIPFLIKEINKYIKNDERNFIIIRYTLERSSRSAHIDYPAYITEYEYECMKKLKELYNEYCIETKAIVHYYDPINCCEIYHNDFKVFESDGEKSALDDSLEYLAKSNSIINYDLKAPKEYILKEK